MRVEDEKFRYAAQVEHAPGLAPVVGDVGAGHVTGYEDGVGIVWADDRAEHSAASAGADDGEISGALGMGRTRNKDKHQAKANQKTIHE